MPSLNPGRRIAKDTPEPAGSEYIVKDVLLTVKTQPLPSNKYDESVCGAGITADGEWIRIYPFEWFRLTDDKRPAKYQWIRLPVKRRSPEQDHRPESHKPNLDAMELGATLSSSQSWQARNKVVLPMVTKSIEEMLANNRSLALIKPKQVKKFLIEKDTEDWGSKKEADMRQRRLPFDKQRVVLEKVPWKFSYRFICNDTSCKGHTLTILDWEIFELYKHMMKHYGEFAIDKVLQAVEETWFNKMWNGSRDSYLYIGTVMHKRFNSPVVLGVYWPPKAKQSNQTTLL